MSLLMFIQESDSAIIITDTLATDAAGEPQMFQSKAWTLPHLNMAIAVTGTANVGALWTQRLASNAVALDIESLDAFAPHELLEIQQELTEVHGPIGSTTIYHFGFPQGSDRLVRYTYRSQTNFESEYTEEPGFGIRPPPETFELNQPDGLDEIIDLAERVRAENDSGLTESNVRIGGEIFMMFVRNWNTQTTRLYRFADFEQHWGQMLSRLNRTQNTT